MTKKFFLKTTILALISIFLASCTSTQNAAPAPKPQTAEEAINNVQENVADEIAKEIQSTSQNESLEPEEAESETDSETLNSDENNRNSGNSQEKSLIMDEESCVEAEKEDSGKVDEISESQTETEETSEAEKVSDEDSNLIREREEAPTSDEREKVSEYKIFEEPDIIVHDLSEIKTEAPAPEQPEKEPEVQETKQEVPELSEEIDTVPKTEETAEIQETVTESPAIPEEEPQQDEVSELSDSLEKENVIPSRTVNVKINQYLDVTYPGSGWIYIGETDKNDIFNYFGRKLGTKNTTFSLRAKKQGKTFLHFYKNDALTGEYIDDYLEVNVENQRGTGRIKAPSYADIVPAKPQRRIDRANASTNTATAEAVKENDISEQKKPITEQKQERKDPIPQAEKEVPAKTESSPVQSSRQSNSDSAPEAESLLLQHSPLAQPSQPESDIKTVIKNETVRQASDYTPVSSESAMPSMPALPEENQIITREPAVISAEENSAADESLLEKAKKDFADKKFADALKEAQEYYNSASTRLDEALYLLGQISESNSQVRDIRFAVDSYDMLVKRFPASKYWKKAKNRSIYLKRFYIDIR